MNTLLTNELTYIYKLMNFAAKPQNNGRAKPKPQSDTKRKPRSKPNSTAATPDPQNPSI